MLSKYRVESQNNIIVDSFTNNFTTQAIISRDVFVLKLAHIFIDESNHQ